MKKFFGLAAVWALFAGFAAGAFCQEFSDRENSLLEQVLQIKLESRMKKTDQEALDWLGERRAEFFSSIDKSQVGDEALLTFENFFAIEQYRFMWEIDGKTKALDDFILTQFNKVMDWNKSRPLENHSVWYKISSCEVINSSLALFKYKQRIALAMEVKNIYDALLAQKPCCGCLYLNVGLWNAFAPAIAGGSDSKALERFEIAARMGPSGYEKFWGFVYVSQMQFKLGDKDASEKTLQEADKILPGNFYTPFVRAMNQAGYNVFEYAADKDKVLAKVKKN